MSRRIPISEEKVTSIIALIDQWPDSDLMTWSHVVEKTHTYLRHLWTRQGLEKHEKIKGAYEAKRARFRAARSGSKPVQPRLPEDEARAQREERHTAEIADLKAALASYDQRFVLHQANAMKWGKSIAELEAPMLAVPRGVSDPVLRMEKAQQVSAKRK